MGEVAQGSWRGTLPNTISNHNDFNRQNLPHNEILSLISHIPEGYFGKQIRPKYTQKTPSTPRTHET